VDEEGQVLAFGQYYERAGRCHFGRLVVSLFVIADNAPAIRLYERLGFAPAVYPEDDPDVRTYLYMVAAARALDASQLLPP
jgi:ribosomal protein S18 acetylase RimI-like enzyme